MSIAKLPDYSWKDYNYQKRNRIKTLRDLHKRMTKAQRKAWYVLHDKQRQHPHLALTARERKWARAHGWKLNTEHPSFRAAYECTIARPDSSHCGFLCGLSEIRRARTLSFLEGAR